MTIFQGMAVKCLVVAGALFTNPAHKGTVWSSCSSGHRSENMVALVFLVREMSFVSVRGLQVEERGATVETWREG